MTEGGTVQGEQTPEPETAGPAPVSAPVSRTRGRLLGGGLLVAAVATVVALDTGVVPLPASSPRPVASPVASTSPTADAAAVQARETGIRSTLQAASAALGSGDAAALAALVDPARAGALTRVQTVAKNLAAMPDTDVGLLWDGAWAPPSTGSDADAVVAHAILRTWVKHYDKAPGTESVDIGMQRSGDRWLMTSWDWVAGDQPPPWAVPGLVAVVKPHVLVVGQAKNAAVTRRLAARAETAVVDAGRVWRGVPGWNRSAVVVAVTDKDYLDAWFGAGLAGPGQDHANYFNTVPTTSSEGTEVAAGFRAVVATDFLLRDNRVTRSDLRFMFTLLAFDGMANTYRVPGWLYYGSADWTAWRAQGATDALETLRARGLADRTWPALKKGSWKPQLTDDQGSFAEGSDAKIENDWDSAFLMTAYIADTFGEPALRSVVVDIAAGGDTDAVLRKYLRMDTEQLSATVRRYARTLAARA